MCWFMTDNEYTVQNKYVLIVWSYLSWTCMVVCWLVSCHHPQGQKVSPQVFIRYTNESPDLDSLLYSLRQTQPCKQCKICLLYDEVCMKFILPYRDLKAMAFIHSFVQ